jgi:hypothetical protein
MLVAVALLAALPAIAGENIPSGEPGGPAYVRMPPIAFSVIGPSNRIDKEVSITLALELEPGKTEQNLEAFRRLLMDSFLVTLTTLYEDENPDGNVDTDELKDRLLKASNQVTGPGMVHEVLVISLGERKRR